MDDEPKQDIYFIGIALPSELDRQIADLKWRLHETNPAALKPLLPHVTLLNPPSLRGIMPSKLIPRIREIADRYLPLTIALQEIEMYGDRVCVIRVQSQSLYSLQSQLVRLLPPEAQAIHYKRPYTPHITVLQVYDPAVIDRKQTRDITTSSLTLPQQFTVDATTCFMRILPREYKPERI